MQSELFDVHAELELNHWWFCGRRQIMQNILAAVLPAGKDTHVVDVGCGTGANIASLADRYTVLGIDTTEKAIDYARQRFANTAFQLGHAPRDLDGPFRHPDAFLLMDVLEHIEDAERVLAELVTALPAGGIMFITVPADMRLWSEHDESFGHYRRYDAASLRATWESLPVTEVLCSYFNSRMYPAARVARTLSRVRSKSWGKAGSDLSVPPGPVNRFMENIFAAESTRLMGVIDGTSKPYRNGVSLVAVLRKQ